MVVNEYRDDSEVQQKVMLCNANLAPSKIFSVVHTCMDSNMILHLQISNYRKRLENAT